MIDTFVIFRTVLAHMSAMPGCLDVEVHRSATEPIEYMVHGRWESKDAWDRAHQTSAEFRGLFAQLPVETALWSNNNVATDGSTRALAEYIEVIGTRA